MKRDKLGYVFIGVICGCIVTMAEDQFDHGMIGTLLFAVLTQIVSLSIIFSLIGTGDTYWNKNSRLLQYLSSACFPIYIIHMLVNTVIGFFVVRFPIPAPVKFFMILILTFLFSFAVYECVSQLKKKITAKN